MDTVMMHTPTLAEFQAWLAAQPDTTLYNEGGAALTCPLARFTRGSVGERGWDVGGLYNTNRPAWCAAFIKAFDNESAYTAHAARAIAATLTE